jgi:hypothetical protein
VCRVVRFGGLAVHPLLVDGGASHPTLWCVYSMEAKWRVANWLLTSDAALDLVERIHDVWPDWRRFPARGSKELTEIGEALEHVRAIHGEPEEHDVTLATLERHAATA